MVTVSTLFMHMDKRTTADSHLSAAGTLSLVEEWSQTLKRTKSAIKSLIQPRRGHSKKIPSTRAEKKKKTLESFFS